MDRYEKMVVAVGPYERMVNSCKKTVSPYEQMMHDVMMMYMLVDLNMFDISSSVVVVCVCVGRLVVSLRLTIEIGPSTDALQVIDQRSKSRNEEKKEKENEHEEDEGENEKKHEKDGDGKDDEDECDDPY